MSSQVHESSFRKGPRKSTSRDSHPQKKEPCSKPPFWRRRRNARAHNPPKITELQTAPPVPRGRKPRYHASVRPLTQSVEKIQVKQEPVKEAAVVLTSTSFVPLRPRSHSVHGYPAGHLLIHSGGKGLDVDPRHRRSLSSDSRGRLAYGTPSGDEKQDVPSTCLDTEVDYAVEDDSPSIYPSGYACPHITPEDEEFFCKHSPWLIQLYKVYAKEEDLPKELHEQFSVLSYLIENAGWYADTLDSVTFDITAALCGQQAWLKDAFEYVKQVEACLQALDPDDAQDMSTSRHLYRMPDCPYGPILADDLPKTYPITSLVAAQLHHKAEGAPGQPFVLLPQTEIVAIHRLQAGRNGCVYTSYSDLVDATRRSIEVVRLPNDPEAKPGCISSALIPHVPHAAFNLFVEVPRGETSTAQPEAEYFGMYIARQSSVAVSLEAWKHMRQETQNKAILCQSRGETDLHSRDYYDNGAAYIPCVELTFVGWQEDIVEQYVV